MQTPAEKHRAEVLAKLRAQDAQAGAGSSAYQLQLGQLNTHRRELSNAKSMARKQVLKAQFLPAYDAWVNGALTAEKPEQDDIIMTVMVWRLDTGDLQGAFDIAKFALANNLKMPAWFKRNTAELITEDFAEYALANIDDEDKQEALLSTLNEVLELTKDHDMVDQARSKLYKALGQLTQENDIETAIAHLEEALRLNPKAGVKKIINTLKKVSAKK